MKIFSVLIVSAVFSVAPVFGAPYAVLGPSTMMDMVLHDAVNGCKGSVRIFTKNAKSLPANLKGGITSSAVVGASPLDSLRAVVACKEDQNKKYAISINMSMDFSYAASGVIEDYAFLAADYDSGWGDDFILPSIYALNLYDYEPGSNYFFSGGSRDVGIVYGVAVSLDLYRALQVAQGIVVPQGVDDRLSQYQPTIWKAHYASIVMDAYNSAKLDWAAFLGLSEINEKLRVCRFSEGTGVQDASNNYFLNQRIGSDGPFGGALSPAAEESWGISAGLTSYEVRESSSAVDVRSCLSQNGYNIGVLAVDSAVERDPRYSVIQPTDRQFRFVKLNGAAPFELISPNYSNNLHIRTQKVMTHDDVESGLYDFWAPVYVAKFADSAFVSSVFQGVDLNSFKRLEHIALGSAQGSWFPIPGAYVSGGRYKYMIDFSRANPSHYPIFIGDVKAPKAVSRAGGNYPVSFD